MSYKIEKRLLDLKPYEPLTGDFRIRLDANESFIPLPGEVLGKFADAVKKLPFNRYPDPYAESLLKAYGKIIGVSPKNLVAGNGSDELIGTIIYSFLSDGDKIATLTPDFSMYAFYTEVRQAVTLSFPRNESFTADADELIDFITREGVKILIFSNPNNPTGAVMPPETVERIVKNAPCLVVVDEAYMDFSYNSVTPLIEKYDNLIVLRTMSKLYGAAALRIGFAAAGKKLVTVLEAALSPYNLSGTSQLFGEIILGEPELTESLKESIKSSKRELYEGLRELKTVLNEEFIPYPSEANFIYIRTNKAREIYNRLLKDGVAVRCFPENALRITAGSKKENQELLNLLRSYK